MCKNYTMHIDVYQQVKLKEPSKKKEGKTQRKFN